MLKPNESLLQLRMVERIDAQNKKIQELEQAMTTVSKYTVDLINNLQGAANAINRLELHLFSMVKVALGNGMEYKELHDAMELLRQSDDLFVFWGLRTQEEADAIKAAAQAAQEEAQKAAESPTGHPDVPAPELVTEV